MTLLRTHTCGALDEKAIDQTVRLCGWVHRRRDHGGLTFIDVRDRWGLTQVVFNPQNDAALHAKAKELRPEFCVEIEGRVAARPKGTENPKRSTGMIEVVAKSLTILNVSLTPPFEIADQDEISEELRYRYRYLDLRREASLKPLVLRHRVVQVIRHLLDAQQFLEVETPILTKSTPEGARDYLVPSRLNPGKFYALPQSPQLFKQILMVAGFDRYYQIARCFRDEDLRADRQPEFTQLDLEISFADEETIFALMEEILAAIWSQVLGKPLEIPFPRLTYSEALARFGTDKPDLRYGMELIDFTGSFTATPFERFKAVLGQGGLIKGLLAKRGAGLTGKAHDELTEIAKGAGAQGLVTVRVMAEGVLSPVAKHLGKATLHQLVAQACAQAGDLILLVADQEEAASRALGALRAHLAKQLNVTPAGSEQIFSFVWVTDFPLFRYNEETRRWDSEHHPFTAPRQEDLGLLESSPGKVRSRSYDLVVNGQELGSGSIRIHQPEVQEAVFRVLGMSAEEAKRRFGFLLEAFRYGAPPHGGIAPGIDRLVALMTGSDSIREGIAFPKTQKGIDLMMDAPDTVSPLQLKEVGIRLT